MAKRNYNSGRGQSETRGFMLSGVGAKIALPTVTKPQVRRKARPIPQNAQGEIEVSPGVFMKPGKPVTMREALDDTRRRYPDLMERLAK